MRTGTTARAHLTRTIGGNGPSTPSQVEVPTSQGTVESSAEIDFCFEVPRGLTAVLVSPPFPHDAAMGNYLDIGYEQFPFPSATPSPAEVAVEEEEGGVGEKGEEAAPPPSLTSETSPPLHGESGPNLPSAVSKTVNSPASTVLISLTEVMMGKTRHARGAGSARGSNDLSNQ